MTRSSLPSAARARTRGARSFLPLGLVALLCGACQDVCRNDLDCNPDERRFKCVQNVCTETLAPEAAPSCADDGDCADIDANMRCVEKTCAFAPSCQFVADGAVLAVMVRDALGAVTTDIVEVEGDPADPCAFTVRLDDPVAALRVTSIAVDDGALVADGCAGGAWTSSEPGGYALGCLEGGATRDWIFARAPASLCFVDDGACDQGECRALRGFTAEDAAGVCE